MVSGSARLGPKVPIGCRLRRPIVARVSFDAYSHFTSLLALLALAGTAVIVGVTMVPSLRRSAGPAISEARLPLALGVAAMATIGSLLYSEIYDLTPCRLCWYQRVAMYPLALLLGLATLWNDRSAARRYGLPLAVVGMGISGYHYLIQRFPDLEGGSCLIDVPCSAAYVWQYGFVSIPLMALAAFAAIVALLAAPISGLSAPSAESRREIR